MKKILEDENLKMVVICVCVLVVLGYLELVYIELEKEVSVVEIKGILMDVLGVIL